MRSYIKQTIIKYFQTQTGTSRYRYVGDDPKTVTLGDLTQESTRYTGSRATLYANGQAVATNRSASLYDNGRAYFGTDILGSVRSATDDYATLEDRYEYDIFGTPYEGDFTGGLNNGYTGKPYDTVTGLYNYGYRDYSPQQARFTTVDPIRDGNNWFSYVVNDPVNYVDLWGLRGCKATDMPQYTVEEIEELLEGITENEYKTGSSSTTSVHPIWVASNGEGFGGSFTTTTTTNIKEKNEKYELTVTVLAISGPQVRHDNIKYSGRVTLNINGAQFLTKNLEAPKGDYIIATGTKVVGEATFTLPSFGDASITVSNVGYLYNTPEGDVPRVSLRKVTIDIEEVK